MTVLDYCLKHIEDSHIWEIPGKTLLQVPQGICYLFEEKETIDDGIIRIQVKITREYCKNCFLKHYEYFSEKIPECIFVVNQVYSAPRKCVEPCFDFEELIHLLNKTSLYKEVVSTILSDLENLSEYYHLNNPFHKAT